MPRSPARLPDVRSRKTNPLRRSTGDAPGGLLVRARRGLIPALPALLLAISACSPSDRAGNAPEAAASLIPSLVASGDLPVQAGLTGTPGGSSPSSPKASSLPGTPAPAASPPPPAAPQSPPSTPVHPLAGIQITHPDSMANLPLVSASGAYLTRNSLIWSVVEPAEGQYNWGGMASLETELIEASERGLELILVVWGTPFWAQDVPGYHCGPVSPEKLPAFADFLHAAVDRYSRPPYNVRYWEIWNEPDAGWLRTSADSQFGCWGDSRDPYYGGSAYGEMLKAAYPRMKAANPDVQVLVGGLLLDCDPQAPPETLPGSGSFKDCTPSRFLEGVLRSGGGDYFDGVSFHAYDYYYGSLGDYRNPNWHSKWNTTGPVLIAKSRFLREILADYGHPEKYLLNTELALLCGRTGRESICAGQDFQDTKSSYLAQAYAVAQAEGLRANIWFSLTGWRGSELVSTGSLVPNSAYRSFTATASFLDGAAYLGELGISPRVRGYRFLRGEEELWILWSKDRLDHVVDLPQDPAALYDIYGEPLPSSRRIEVTLAPIWAVFPANQVFP